MRKAQQQPPKLKYTYLLPMLSVALLTALGFYLRLAYLEQMIFHVDEYMSLLAVSTILERGIPILPSGMLYDHGLLFSYVAALFAASAGFSEAIVRWVSVICGTLIIPVMYALARRMFYSSAVAIPAALVIAIYPEAIRWGGRARMHSQAQLLYAVALLYLWLGLTGTRGQKYRLFFYITFVAVLFSHFVMILAVPVLIVATLLFGLGWLRNKEKSLNPAYPEPRRRIRQWWTLEVLVAIGFLAFGLLAGHFITNQISQAASAGAGGDKILDIGFSLGRFSTIIEFAQAPENIGLFVLAVIGLIVLVYKRTSHRLTRVDEAGAFLLVVLLGIIIETSLLLADQWRTERYYFIVLLPLLILTGIYGLKQIIILSERFWPHWAKHDIQKLSQPAWVISGLIFIGLAVMMLPRTTHIFNETSGTYRYNEAMRYVTSQRSADDILMTVLPAAGALYAQPVDYYIDQSNPFLIPNKTGDGWIDRYAGAPHIGTAGAFNDVLATQGRAWLVADDRRITRHDTYLMQQIQHQMTLDRRFDNVQILVEKENRWPLAEKPVQQAEIDLSGQVIYAGHTLIPLGQALSLTLFWKLVAPQIDFKVFVHLRDTTGQTVAQADFLPYDGTTGFHSYAKSEGSADLFRTGTILQLPSGLPSGSYNLFVGLYVPSSGQRVPVARDSTGENAIDLGTVLSVAEGEIQLP